MQNTNNKKVEISKVDAELFKYLTEEGYTFILEIPGKGVCAVKGFFFTDALVYGITKDGYEGRYCYKDFEKAILGLNDWAKQIREHGEVVEHPRDTYWIKHKAAGINERNTNIFNL